MGTPLLMFLSQVSLLQTGKGVATRAKNVFISLSGPLVQPRCLLPWELLCRTGDASSVYEPEFSVKGLARPERTHGERPVELVAAGVSSGWGGLSSPLTLFRLWQVTSPQVLVCLVCRYGRVPPALGGVEVK